VRRGAHWEKLANVDEKKEISGRNLVTESEQQGRVLGVHQTTRRGGAITEKERGIRMGSDGYLMGTRSAEATAQRRNPEVDPQSGSALPHCSEHSSAELVD